MRKLFFSMLTYGYTANSQSSVNNYIGTWKGEKGDTVFVIKLIKKDTFLLEKVINLLGGYYVSIKNKYTDDYLKINTHRIFEKKLAEQHIYIDASYRTSSNKNIGFHFYDQRKRHFNGEGITRGWMEYIVPNKLRWKLDEKMGIWWATEEGDDYGAVKPIGFSVPSDIILTKVKE